LKDKKQSENTRFEVGRESLPLGFTWVKEEKRTQWAEGDCSRQRTTTRKNMEVIGDVEWQLGNFTS